MARNKPIHIVLPARTQQRLERLALAEDREPEAQARHMLRRMLDETPDPVRRGETREAVKS